MNGSKIKLAISRKCNKNKRLNSSAYGDRNKQIADFILQKSAAIFANYLHDFEKIMADMAIHGRAMLAPASNVRKIMSFTIISGKDVNYGKNC